VQLDPRKIIIKEFQITHFEPPVIGFRVVCSTGTYIRSLAHDFGKVLQCGAYLSSLRRTRIGDFHVDGANSIADFTQHIQKIKP
jgi:tRNA pseudouridine55 synthase